MAKIQPQPLLIPRRSAAAQLTQFFRARVPGHASAPASVQLPTHVQTQSEALRQEWVLPIKESPAVDDTALHVVPELSAFPVHLENLTLSYQRHPVVHHISGVFEAASLTAITGPNGAGKSSLLAALAGRSTVTTGTISIAAHARIAYLPQRLELDRDFPISVFDVAMLGQWSQLGVMRGANSVARAEVMAALRAVELLGFEKRSVGELSVGQLQRLLFAQVILQNANIILLDEPFNGIDARTTQDLVQMVQLWHTQGRTVIAVLHDFELMKAVFPRTLLLARKVIAWGNTDEVLQLENIQRARVMSEHWIDNAPWCATHGSVHE